ncbi:MAG: nucleotide exchange factor GrpE, partial [Clostridiales Family XIII bacterium]|nr:nucleotide exchange factor GrpE [Clostridiales Family XIII bacterium]
MRDKKEKNNPEATTEEVEDILPDAEGVKEEASDAAPEDVPEAGQTAEPTEEEAWKDRYIRLLAEFENYKKRTDKEKSSTYSNAIGSFAGDLLEVVDNFERAVVQDVSTKVDERFLEGMQLILDQLAGILKKNGVEEIVAEGEEFNPNLHDALTMIPGGDVESNHIVQVVQKG